MDSIGHKLATSERGMTQEHYATIQACLINEIDRKQWELEFNRKWYVSCTKCNMVFQKEILIEGICRKCTYPDENLKMDLGTEI